MLQNFFIALHAVIPFMVYIMSGYIVRRVGLATEELMKKMNQLIFRVFFPFLMFYNVYSAAFSLASNIKLLLMGLVTVPVLIAVLLLTVPRIVKENPKRSVIIQGIYRSNIVLFAVPLSSRLFGEEGVALATLFVAFIVPMYNVFAVIILEHYAGNASSPGALVKNIMKNPLVLGALIGGLFRVLHIHVPEVLLEPISVYASLTTPLALFVLGGTLYFSRIGKNLRYVISSLFIKMVFLPAISFIIGRAFTLSSAEQFVYFALFATPVAASSYPMAQNMGGDGELAGQFVVLSTAASVFTLFLWIFFMKSVGII